ncbi:hypothetical protein NC652_032585 [Populus alba x Populus x berolinensis]|nr:hypothetical protein NC652_032585 [Populus alba x Populus x berolinensis]
MEREVKKLCDSKRSDNILLRLTGGGSSIGRRLKQGEDGVHSMRVSLEDLKGSKSGASGTCHGCQDSGMKVPIQQIGLGMVQQMQQHVCPECGGSGELISEKNKCPLCRGNRVTQEKMVLEVHVEKGMQHGQKMVFEGQADEAALHEGQALYPFYVEFPDSGSLFPPQQCEETIMHDCGERSTPGCSFPSWLNGAHSVVGFGCSRQQDLSSVVQTIIRHMEAVNLSLETTTPKRFFYGMRMQPRIQ